MAAIHVGYARPQGNQPSLIYNASLRCMFWNEGWMADESASAVDMRNPSTAPIEGATTRIDVIVNPRLPGSREDSSYGIWSWSADDRTVWRIEFQSIWTGLMADTGRLALWGQPEGCGQGRARVVAGVEGTG